MVNRARGWLERGVCEGEMESWDRVAVETGVEVEDEDAGWLVVEIWRVCSGG